MPVGAANVGALQNAVLNDVAFQSADVDVALNQQIAHASKVSAQLERRLFALQAELQQCRDAGRGAASALAEVRGSRERSPRAATSSASLASTPRRTRHYAQTLNSAQGEAAGAQLDGAIQAVGAALSMLTAIAEEMTVLESRLSIEIRWLRDMVRRDSDCLTSLNCRKQKAREYRHDGGIQLSSQMSPTDWPHQANDTFVAAGGAIQRSADARRSAAEVCKHAHLMAARAKKASLDALTDSISSRMEERHALQCELQTLSKQRFDTDKTLATARENLDTLKDPLRVALARQQARKDIDDGAGAALRSEKDAVVRGYRQLRHLTKQLESDLGGMRQSEDSVRHRLADLEVELSADRVALEKENPALRIGSGANPPKRTAVRTYAEHMVPAPNPISWDNSAAASSRELPFSLWNNLCARQYPGQRRDPKSGSPRSTAKNRQDGDSSAPAPSNKPIPVPPKTARATGSSSGAAAGRPKPATNAKPTPAPPVAATAPAQPAQAAAAPQTS